MDVDEEDDVVVVGADVVDVELEVELDERLDVAGTVVVVTAVGVDEPLVEVVGEVEADVDVLDEPAAVASMTPTSDIEAATLAAAVARRAVRAGCGRRGRPDVLCMPALCAVHL